MALIRLNPLAILSIQPDADQAVIDSAYRRLALEYHPDVYQDDQDPIELAAKIEIFEEVEAAYQMLCDPQTRTVWLHPREMPKDMSSTPHARVSRSYGSNPRYFPRRNCATKGASKARNLLAASKFGDIYAKENARHAESREEVAKECQGMAQEWLKCIKLGRAALAEIQYALPLQQEAVTLFEEAEEAFKWCEAESSRMEAVEMVSQGSECTKDLARAKGKLKEMEVWNKEWEARVKA
ncbi:DnaJ-domain-containing protein [Mytilinidion resinicola]|uniref:DnaJ-domain-containing protein n=1 Tax=Mytilinidion resinicola TaxID=574789 RepID=A0A6A6YN07_9PEZI|nr:DnaJ-domain-containing protein [Mytilinidion resinicola]KAF2809257.1 DnaJ-domain-containing protein [Mytilinidion resinicola]